MVRKKQKVAFLGLRSLPPTGGGSETFASEIGERIAKRGWEVFVYCRSYLANKERLKEYNGIKLIWVPSINNKNIDTPLHTFLSVIHIILFNKVDVVQLGGVGNALVLPILKLFNFKSIVIVDGADWERDKWGKLARGILKMSARLTSFLANKVICDSQIAQKYYKEIFSTDSIYIPYGGKIPKNIDLNILTKYGLKINSYILFVGQLKPEKGVHFLIEGFKKADTDLSLIIIGKSIIEKYTSSLKKHESPNIKFLPPIYGEEIESIMAGAAFYVQPSFVEGTSPVILQNLALGNIVLVNGIPENLETIGDAGLSYMVNDTSDLKKKIEFIKNNLFTLKNHLGPKAIKRINEIYNWDLVCDRYMEIYDALIEKR